MITHDEMVVKTALGFGCKSATEILNSLTKFQGYEKKDYSWLRERLDSMEDKGHVLIEDVLGHVTLPDGVWC